MLDFLNYHVGETRETSSNIRRCILEYAFECHLPPLGNPNYHSEWGELNTSQRLQKLANTLAACTRNAKRQSTTSYSAAIDSWEADLVFLYDRYYVSLFNFGWPAS
jgi:hypothetical protein